MKEFYSALQSCIDGTPKKDFLLVMGDLNAKVGSTAQQNVTG
jgi:hypothetical protein